MLNLTPFSVGKYRRLPSLLDEGMSCQKTKQAWKPAILQSVAFLEGRPPCRPKVSQASKPARQEDVLPKDEAGLEARDTSIRRFSGGTTSVSSESIAGFQACSTRGCLAKRRSRLGSPRYFNPRLFWRDDLRVVRKYRRLPSLLDKGMPCQKTKQAWKPAILQSAAFLEGR